MIIDTQLRVKAKASLDIEADLKAKDKSIGEVLNAITTGNDGRGPSKVSTDDSEKVEQPI